MTTKLPQPGEYWRTRGGDIAFVAFDKSTIFPDDPYPLQCYIASGGGLELTQSGTDYETMQSSNDLIEHLPDCTGFDWKPKPAEVPAVDPGKGYELLPVGTVLQEGDEALHSSKWYRTVYAGTEYKEGDGNIYRRKIKPAEMWPKWYVLDETQGSSIKPWAIERYTTDKSWRYDSEGSREHQSFPLKKPVSWLEVTEAEALARIKPPATLESLSNCQECGEFRGHGHECKPVELCQMCSQPAIPGTGGCLDCTLYAIDATSCAVEDPEEWVTQDRVPVRPVFDECRWSSWNNDCWITNNENTYTWMHGRTEKGDQGKPDAVLSVRCRRKDLPNPQPAEPRYQSDVTCSIAANQREGEKPTVKRVPVRLYWYDGCIVGRYDHFRPTDKSFQELHSDGNGGWCVEVAE